MPDSKQRAVLEAAVPILSVADLRAALDYYRAVRDAMSEAAFFQVYGNMFNFNLAERRAAEAPRAAPAAARIFWHVSSTTGAASR